MVLVAGTKTKRCCTARDAMTMDFGVVMVSGERLV